MSGGCDDAVTGSLSAGYMRNVLNETQPLVLRNTGVTDSGHIGGMKTSEARLQEERRQRAEAAVEEHVHALFSRLPMLSGFSLRHDLEFADVAVQTWPGYTAGAEFYLELVQTLAELAEERPEAVELLRGRTFARAVH